jgi:hypothetical protein
MKSCNYIDAKTFADFKENQNKLIEVLNHNMTKMSNNVSWIKTLLITQIGVVLALSFGILLKGWSS